MPDFLELANKDTPGRGYGYSPGGSSKTDLSFPRTSCTLVEMFAVVSKFPWASFPLGELCAERLYKVGFVDRIVSVYADCDWVTPLRISPQTFLGLFLFRLDLKETRPALLDE